MSINRRFISKFADNLLGSTIAISMMVISVLPSAANAEKQVSIYTDKQLVLDQSVNLRQQAIRVSLSAVLIRVTGNTQVVSQSAIQQALSSPSAYLRQYRYAKTDEVITIAGASRPAQQLWLEFSPSAIEQLLKSAQLPIWSDIRPEILLWVATDDQGRRIVGAGSSPVQKIKRLAQARGVPLALPSLDLIDRRALTPARLWARDEASIENASARYGADGVLAGRIEVVSASTWRASFILQYNQRSHYFVAESENTTSLLQNIVNQMTQVLAQANAVVIDDNLALPSMLIAVDNVTRFATYAHIIDRFSELSAVSYVMLQEVNRSYLLVSVRYQGRQDRLLSQLEGLENFEAISVSEFVTAHSQRKPPTVNAANHIVIDDNDESASNEDVDSALETELKSTFPIINTAFMWLESP